MAFVTYPLNNIEYTAEDAELFHVTRTSGIYAKNSFQYSVSGANNIIIIGTGIGWIKNREFAGKVIAQKEAVSIDMGIADSVYPRIDAIVIQFSANNNETNIVVKKGAASTNAVAPPVVRDESVYELHLYHVLRKAGELTISPSNITDLRLDANYCGLMADSVTSVDTNAINLQASSLIEDLRREIESVEDESIFWLKNDIIPVSNGGTGATSPEQARNNLGITIKNIGAAPAGHGVGVVLASEGAVGDANTLKMSGLYCANSTSTNVPYLEGILQSFVRTENERMQKYYSMGAGYELMRYGTGGSFSEWEWVHPPMYPGVEYRTRERYDGKVVYTMCVNCGASPTSGYKTVDLTSTLTGVETIISLSVFRDGAGMYSHISGSQTSATWSGNATAYPVTSSVRQVYIILGASGSSDTNANVRAILRYTKV